ncbi:hypothetical protein AAL_08402 [Moelleriella libera RCEF 2490]|uniref:Uncharacterized protein n=1 Tax=Moelleriella libera RCEF 2490 TaxID=1081109 RepID=A0A167VBD9_9HYPO|nr:hypothetical protein AAL_08402 [Moelleriella libera RCEF 2490]
MTEWFDAILIRWGLLSCKSRRCHGKALGEYVFFTDCPRSREADTEGRRTWRERRSVYMLAANAAFHHGYGPESLADGHGKIWRAGFARQKRMQHASDQSRRKGKAKHESRPGRHGSGMHAVHCGEKKKVTVPSAPKVPRQFNQLAAPHKAVPKRCYQDMT